MLFARLVSLVALAWALIALWGFTRPLPGPNSNSCRPVSMSPAYAKLHAFDASHTPLASKYGLYLYREQGRDVIPDPERHSFSLGGTPVLFIPGNAGSFKQVRSIASETTLQYSSSIHSNKLDFFTADFNEDFTAFHGRTMLDQAQYLNEAIKFILSLYQNNENPPKSVILLGHSMGGIVSRVMLSLPNYQTGSVNTILTLAAPHSAAPTTFDGDLLQVFTLTDDFWRTAFKSGKEASVAHERLSQVSIVSITGGHLDTTLPADYTSLNGLVPESNGLTVSTTGIPGVWTPIDHLAIVWCDQLRNVIAKLLLEIVDKSSPYQTLPLNERMDVFKSHLLTNFDKNFELPPKETAYLLKFDYKQFMESPDQKPVRPMKKIIKRNVDLETPELQVFYKPKDDNTFKFNLISSLKPEMMSGSSNSVMLCKTATNGVKEYEYYEKVFDYTSKKTKQFVELECISLHDSIEMIPRSDSIVKSLSDSSFKGPKSPFYSLEIPASVLQDFSTVIITKSENTSSDDFIIGDLEIDDVCNETLGSNSLWELIWQGADLTLVPNSCSIVNIAAPAVRSGLLAYHLDVRYKKSELERFSPLISQYIPGELKWHINIDDNKILNILINGEAPYVPIPKSGNDYLKLKIFADKNAGDIMDLYLSIDWLTSFSLIILKYRLSIIGFPLFVTIICFILQLRKWFTCSHFPDFGWALNELCTGNLFLGLLFAFSIASPLSSSRMLGPIISKLNPVKTPNWSLLPENLEVNWNFLGIEEYNLWFYGPLMFSISIILNYLVYFLLMLAKRIIVSIIKLILRPSKAKQKNANTLWMSLAQLFLLPLNVVTFVLSVIFLKLGFSVQGRIRRSIGVVVLTIMVLLYLPYQFAYIVACIAHVVGCLRLNVNYERSAEIGKKSKIKSNVYESQMNFNFTLLLLLLWILPIQVPILIVWIHNLSLRWTTPFSSHHNVLAILPIILVVLACNRNTNIGIDESLEEDVTSPEEENEKEEGAADEQTQSEVTIKDDKHDGTDSSAPFTTRALQTILLALLSYMGFYCVMFGTRHLFFIHGLFDIVCVVLLICWVNGALGGTLHSVGLMGYSRGWRDSSLVSKKSEEYVKAK